MMNAQQYLDIVITPTLNLMSEHGKYNTAEAKIMLLATLAIESDMGLYNRQIVGPAISPFQLEPPTIFDVSRHWDKYPKMTGVIRKISNLYDVTESNLALECEVNSRLACLIARGKYAMDKEYLPDVTDRRDIYEYYKRVYNSALGASNYSKFVEAWNKHKLSEVKL